MSDAKYFAFAAHNDNPETDQTFLFVRLLNDERDLPVLKGLAEDAQLGSLMAQRGFRFADAARLVVYRGVESRFLAPTEPPPYRLPSLDEVTSREGNEAKCDARLVRDVVRDIHRRFPLQHLGRLSPEQFKRVVDPRGEARGDANGWVHVKAELKYGQMQQYIIALEPKPEAVSAVRVEHYAGTPDEPGKPIGRFDVVFLPGDPRFAPLDGFKWSKAPLPEYAKTQDARRRVGPGC